MKSEWIPIDFKSIQEETGMGPRSQAKACQIRYSNYQKYMKSNAAPPDVAKIIAERLKSVIVIRDKSKVVKLNSGKKSVFPTHESYADRILNINKKGAIKRKPRIKPHLDKRFIEPEEIKRLREKVFNT
ncbi:MAG: hypothetical protein K9L57_07435 [Spirochaetaceae bacterium]|nr:hypothetical protein [Spirochaetia bacterium]MCF7951451.1 hypothetical protein [Spirochaetaceae bacterium]